MKVFNNYKKIILIMYLLYFVVLLAFVTCKIQDICYSIPNNKYFHMTMDDIQRNREVGFWNYNLIPFRAYYDWFTHGVWDGLIWNLLGNIVAFVPMGFFEMALSKHKKFWKVVLKCLIIVSCLELFQFITCLGYLDIDDITMNTFGCLLGCLCFNLLVYICKVIKTNLKV